MKKEFNPILRIVMMAQGDMIATSGGPENPLNGTIKDEVITDARHAPGRANGILAGVADQK